MSAEHGAFAMLLFALAACGRTGLSTLADGEVDAGGGGKAGGTSGGGGSGGNPTAGGGGATGGSATGGGAMGGSAMGGSAHGGTGTGGSSTGGSSEPDPCRGVSCANAPEATCADEHTILRYVEPGVCVMGVCSYETTEGACPDAPAPSCSADGKTLTTSFGPGRCVGNATCNYGASMTACNFGCASGRCLDARDVVQISAGEQHSCVRLAEGSALCWGSNYLGQLGIGTTSDSESPTAVLGSAGLVDLRAGRFHTCAVRADGTATCWGYNSRGQLGDGTKDTSPSPVVVTGLTDVRAIAPGLQHTCALLSTGWVACWGSNYEGMLGDGTTSESSTPVLVQGLSDASALAATGELASSGHSCVISGRTVRCWGANYHGELGNGSMDASNVPVTVLGLDDARSVALGPFQSVALAGSGVVRWGLDWETQEYLTSSTRMNGLEDATALAAGSDYACALRATGTVWCWGKNDKGQLGDGTYEERVEPVEVVGLDEVVALSAGYEHACALVASGAVYCWGDNVRGKLGSSGFDGSPTPVVVPGVGTGPKH